MSLAVQRNQLQRFVKLQARSVMKRNVLSVQARLTLRELDHLFSVYDFNSFPVVEDHHVIGIVTKFDFLKAFIFTPSSVVPHYDELMKRTVGEIMTRDVLTVHPTTPLTRVLQMVVDQKSRSFPVVDAKNRLQGIISRGDVISALSG